MARRRIAKARPGDLVEVSWLDICENPVGDPQEAALARRVSYGLFLERRKDCGVDAIVTTTTRDQFGSHQSGWCIYPVGCIVAVQVVRRAKA